MGLRVGVAVVALIGCGRQNFNPPDAPEDVTRANYAFVTSTLHTGDLGGLEGADAICNERALAGGLPGTYRALLSTTTVDAVARFDGSRGWQRVDGKPIADRLSQLTARRGWFPIAVDELGHDLRGELQTAVWTGSKSDGTGRDTCASWTSEVEAELGEGGALDSGGARMFDTGRRGCDQRLRLYCFEEGERAVTPPPVVDGRRAFATFSEWVPGGGIVDADRLCNSEASAAGLVGSFAAALRPDSATTASRFEASALPWVRTDGVAITPAATLFSAVALDVPIHLGASGEPLPPDASVWAGSPLVVTGGNCGNWASTSGESPETGSVETTDYAKRFSFGAAGCSAMGIRLMCLER